MKKRIIGLDILRDIGVIFIFFYHFFVEYIVTAGGGNGPMAVYNYFFNIMARPASLFLFIISGYALMYNNENELSPKTFYIRRFKGLFIPFYVAYTLLFLISCAVQGQLPWVGVPVTRFIFTIFGIDGVMQLVCADFYLVGEWFMSCIVFCYLLFPLLSWLMKKIKYLLLVAMVVWYGILLFVWNPFSFAVLMNPMFIVVYFYFGMVLYELIGKREVRTPIRVLCIILTIATWVYLMMAGYAPTIITTFPSQEFLEIVYMIMSVSLLLFLRDVNLKQDTIGFNVIKYISNISWFIILVHHRIMILLYSKTDLAEFDAKKVIVLLVLSIVLSGVLAEIVRFLSKKIRQILP